MEKIRFGKTEMMVSRIGFGGIPIQRVSEEEAVAIVKHCLDLGINFIDTAQAYTTSEERIGKAIKGYRREDIYITTKSHAHDGKGVRKALEESLKKLDTDYVDLYQFHDIHSDEAMAEILGPGGAYEELERCKSEGLIHHIGATAHKMDMAIKLVKCEKFVTMQFPFNYITDEAKNELIPLCREYDQGFLVMKPFSGGVLPNAKLAFKFLLQYPDILPIPGVQSIAEIDEIVAISQDSKLTEEEIAAIASAKEELGKQFCRRCDYCQPCPVKINISDVMYANTIWKRMPLKKVFTTRFGEQLELASSCKNCGICEKRCPFELPIREIMKRNLAEYYENKRKWQESEAAEAK
jgi:predicted aldo/keto reductase-like oxidoreductase